MAGPSSGIPLNVGITGAIPVSVSGVNFVTSVAANVYTVAIPAAGTYFSTMVDCQNLRNLIFKVTNTCDQIITVQTIGNTLNAAASAVLLDGAMAVGALTGIITVGINLQIDDWHPFIGMQIVVPAGVTLGSLVIDQVNRY